MQHSKNPRAVLGGLILFVLFVLHTSVAHTQVQAVDRKVRVVFVQGTTGEFSEARRAAALDGVQRAMSFWEELSPITTTLTLAGTDTITITDELTGSLEWSRPYWTPDLTVFIIDSPGPLVGDAWAQSQTYFGLIWVLTGDGAVYEATVAHEFGHVLYGLPHAYFDSNDIMGLTPWGVYLNHQIGCTTSATLGRPCHYIHLPIVVR